MRKGLGWLHWDHFIVRCVCLTGTENDGTTADCLCVVTYWRDGFDGACFVAPAGDETWDAATVSDSLGRCETVLCGGGSAGDERGAAGGQRSVCAPVGAGACAFGASDVFCDSEIPAEGHVSCKF